MFSISVVFTRRVRNEIESEEESWKFCCWYWTWECFPLKVDRLQNSKMRKFHYQIQSAIVAIYPKIFFNLCKNEKIWHWKFLTSTMTRSLFPHTTRKYRDSWISNAENFALFLATSEFFPLFFVFLTFRRFGRKKTSDNWHSSSRRSVDYSTDENFGFFSILHCKNCTSHEISWINFSFYFRRASVLGLGIIDSTPPNWIQNKFVDYSLLVFPTWAAK